MKALLVALLALAACADPFGDREWNRQYVAHAVRMCAHRLSFAPTRADTLFVLDSVRVTTSKGITPTCRWWVTADTTRWWEDK